MDTSTAIANIVVGSEVAHIARCIDTLLKADYSDSEVFSKLLPFLGKDLLEKNVIDYSAEPGIDIHDRYFVLWEPFIRAKTALLVGTIAEKCSGLEKVEPIIPYLIDMVTSEEEIEQSFSFLAISNIGLKQPSLILPHMQKLVRSLTQLVATASAPSRPFCLFHSLPFQNQLFESFLDFCFIPGLFEPEHISRFVEAGLPVSLVQIALSTYAFDKKPELQWRVLETFLKLITEHPQGSKLFDSDRIPSTANDLCFLMKSALTNKELPNSMRNAFYAIKEMNANSFAELVKKYKK